MDQNALTIDRAVVRPLQASAPGRGASRIGAGSCARRLALHDLHGIDPAGDACPTPRLPCGRALSAPDGRRPTYGHEQITNPLAAGEFEAAARQMISPVDTVEAGLTQQIDKDPLIDLRLALLRPLKPERPDP